MLNSCRKFIQASLLLLISVHASAQTSSSSPYSRYGIGELQFNGFTKNMGMGGISAGYSPALNLNITNPASYSSLSLTTFESAVNMNQVQLKTVSKTQNIFDASLSYFAFGFPVKNKKWGAGFGLLPYSNVGYSINDGQTNFAGQQELHTYQGSGGLNQFFIGNGYSPFKNFNIGLNASYLFGVINQERRIEYPKLNNYFNTRIKEETSVGAVYFNFGMQYTIDSLHLAKRDSGISEKRHWSLTLGFTGSPSTALSADYARLSESFVYSAFDNIVVRDTIENVADQSGKLNLPLNLGFGLMFRQGNRWLVGSDFSFQNWKDYTIFGTSDSLGNSWRIGAGAQFHPRPGANDLLDKKISFWKKMEYRMGFHYSQTYLKLRGNQLNEYGVSIGFGIPVKRSAAMIHLGAEAGKRGTTKNNLIEESYLKFSIGFTLNDRWFIKQKFD